MPEMQGTINVEHVREKEWNNRKFWQVEGIHSEKDVSWTGVVWSSSLKDRIREGEDNLLKWDQTEKNGYTNRKITNVADNDGNFATVQRSSGGRVAKADPAKTNSIERQVAAKEAWGGVIAGVYGPESFELNAKKILKFIQGE